MAKYRKKPVVVEAEQWFPGKVVAGVLEKEGESYVVTIHGQRAWIASGDWIITEPDGKHHYPCKPDVFEASYDLVKPYDGIVDLASNAILVAPDEIIDQAVLRYASGRIIRPSN